MKKARPPIAGPPPFYSFTFAAQRLSSTRSFSRLAFFAAEIAIDDSFQGMGEAGQAARGGIREGGGGPAA
jgi:hypothetical protein